MIVEQTETKFPQSKNRRILLTLLIVTLILIFLVAGFVYKDKILNILKNSKSLTDSRAKLISQTTKGTAAIRQSEKFHRNLFYVNLELDPKTSTLSQVSTSFAQGDPPSLLSDKPASSSAQLVYKVE